MTQFSQLGLAFAEGTHQNHFLFSDHYLNTLLRREAVWEAGQGETAVFFHWLRDLYQQERDNLPIYNEAQLEENWIRPILNKLGWEGTAETQAVIPALAEANIRKPDYVFFPSLAARQTAVSQQNTPAYAQEAVAVGEAKRWTALLDKKVRGGAANFDNNNPSYQIDYYLRATNVTWGVLTNGRLWRLVHKDTSYKLDVYFEFDLETAVKNNHLDALRYFTLFFGHSSFVPNRHGNIFVSDALSESVRYARELESDLRDNAYKALEQIISGFFAMSHNRLDPTNPTHLSQVYTNSLYLLYRLLFLLYGESRGLLPLDNAHYRAVSLTALVKETDPALGSQTTWNPYTRQVWIRLNDLFHLINGTDTAMNRAMGVPRYNGGLFSPDLHPFLEEKAMGDSYLVQAIDYLARRDSHKQGDYAVKEPVDYRTLGVRQLGSIYEGLLEYAPRAATEPMVTVRRKGREVWLPARERGKAKAVEQREVGALYLATDKGERKATGSYYTPDYIVKYIVEQTLNPLLAQARQQAAAGTAVGVGAGLRPAPTDQAQHFIDEVLALNVLDPAMGSGHFLVEATDHLARALATDEWVQAESGSDDAEADLVYWRRRVVEACIYGVDKNPMAVELAKLSLWLVTVAKDKPLSFLDHHLRHGDSLVGARLADLVTLPSGKKASVSDQQLALLNETALAQDLFRAVGGMGRIEGMLSETLEDVHAKEVIFAQLRQQLDGWRTLANVWTSSFFGNAMSPEEYREVARHLQGEATGLSTAQLAPFLQHPAVADNDYFHWELAFPEIFFDMHGQPLGDRAGFDAVIGNPPYVRVQTLRQSNSNAVELMLSKFESASGSFDIFMVMAEQSLSLTISHGSVGLIIPNKFLTSAYGEPFRKNVSSKRSLKKLIDFQYGQVFADATTYTCLFFATGSPNQYAQYVALDEPETITSLQPDEFSQVSNDLLSAQPWTFPSKNVRKLLGKLKAQSSTLGTLADRLFQGIRTSSNECYVLQNAVLHGKYLTGFSQALGSLVTVEKDICSSFYGGDQIKRYELLSSNQFVIIPYIFTSEKVSLISLETLELEYPQAFAYFKQVEDILKARENGRLSSTQEWHGYIYPKNLEVMNQPKIMSRDIVENATFALDGSGKACFVTGYGITLKKDTLYSPLYVLAILNSKLGDFALKQLNTFVRGGYVRIFSQYLEPLPIKRFEFASSQSNRGVMLSNIQNSLKKGSLPEELGSSDIAHDAIVWLVEQIIAIHAYRQQLERRFWLDMEGVAGDGLAKLQKGKWEESLHKEVAAARPFVRPDSRSTRSLEASLGWNEAAFRGFVRLLLGKVKGLADMVEVYNSYHADYAALVQRIAQTDGLIDQIVYKLYGLTDEEIAIVEGA